ncbi:MAG: metallophosphoesterase family protein [Candidatus Hydrogenedentes bacterium]|nr:metallophosphoesterase family protein [Candidatus Hydrogenedentota bacterium]
MGDLHGNLPALEFVLNEIESEGIQIIVNTGDIAVGGASPKEVIQCLRERRIPSAQSETDRWLTRFSRKRSTFSRKLPPEDFAALESAYGLCTSENLEYLGGLPRLLQVKVDGISIAICHGSLTSQRDELSESDPDMQFLRQREILHADVYVFGRSHHPYWRSIDGQLYLNPGSVGMSTKGSRASCYAVVSTEDEPWTVTHRYAAY